MEEPDGEVRASHFPWTRLVFRFGVRAKNLDIIFDDAFAWSLHEQRNESQIERVDPTHSGTFEPCLVSVSSGPSNQGV
jgi:hypothetical protein